MITIQPNEDYILSILKITRHPQPKRFHRTGNDTSC